MSEVLLIDKENNRQKEYDDPEAAQEEAEKLRDLGADVELEPIGASTDGGKVNAEVVDHTQNGDSDERTQETDVVEDQPEKPDRSITDDPIQWLGTAGDFTYQVDGQTAINKKGLRVLQHWYDIDIGQSKVIVGPEETDHTYCRARAEATMPDGRTAVAHGSAHVDRGDDSHLLVEMADTRAKSRVLLDITGMGAVAVSELQNEL